MRSLEPIPGAPLAHMRPDEISEASHHLGWLLNQALWAARAKDNPDHPDAPYNAGNDPTELLIEATRYYDRLYAVFTDANLLEVVEDAAAEGFDLSHLRSATAR